MADGDGSGSNAILGVVVGAVLVVAVIFFAFGGVDIIRGDGPDVNVEVPAPQLPAPTPAN